MANSNNTSSGESVANKRQPMLSADELLSLSVEEIFSSLQTSNTGLTSEEAENRLELYGPNELAHGKKHSAVTQFLLNFKSPLVIILMVAGLISGLLQILGLTSDGLANFVIIYIIVFISVILDYYQESKAEKAAATLDLYLQKDIEQLLVTGEKYAFLSKH